MIEDKVLKTIRERKMISSGDRVLVAFSGGVDSTALIYLLNSLRKELKIKLFAAHLNHGIRGKDADLDAGFAAKTAEKLGIPFVVEGFDVPSFAKSHKLSLEDAARRVRYEFLERTAVKFKAEKIALAHNADDNIETFLMRLIRGTGMKGLEGIPPVRGKIIRPLIHLYRGKIEKYLSSKKITPRIDRTNFETRYLRNRVRRDLVPALVSYNSNIKDLMLKTISTAGCINQFIEGEAKKALNKMLIMKSAGEIRLDTKEFIKADPALKGEILRLAIQHVKGDLEDISFVNIDDMIGQAAKKRAELDLPGIYVLIKKGVMSISGSKPGKIGPVPFIHTLQVPGEIKDKDRNFIIKADVLPSVGTADLHAKRPYQAYLDYDKIQKPLIVRSRRAGDVFSPLGLKGKKKLQDIFVDEKKDIDERDNVPVIEDGRKIIWLVGYRISEDAKVTRETKKVVKLSAWNIR